MTEGKITKGCGIRVIRKGKTVHVGVLDSLRRVKETVEEVNICHFRTVIGQTYLTLLLWVVRKMIVGYCTWLWLLVVTRWPIH